MANSFLSTGILSVNVKVGKQDMFLVMVSDPDLKGLVFMVDKINNPIYEFPKKYLAAKGIKADYKLGWIQSTGKAIMRRLLPDGTVDTEGTLAIDDKGISKLLTAIEKQVKANPMLLESLLSIEDLVGVAGNAMMATGIPKEQVSQFAETFLNGKIAKVQDEIRNDWKIESRHSLSAAINPTLKSAEVATKAKAKIAK